MYYIAMGGVNIFGDVLYYDGMCKYDWGCIINIIVDVFFY